MAESTTGGGLSDCCASGWIRTGTPKGSFEEIGGRKTYVSLPEDGSKAKTIVYITDIFGVDLPNHQLLADIYAKSGFRVLVPDLFDGDALPHEFLDTVEPTLNKREKESFIESTKRQASTMATLGPWSIKHREAVSKPKVDAFIAAVKADPSVHKIGTVGFCWGGRHSVLQAVDGSGVDAAVALHAAMTGLADFEAVTKPLSLGFGDKDSVVPMKDVDGIISVLEKKTEVPHEIRIYPDQIHGFAVRGDHTSEKEKQAMNDAAQQAVEWFQKYLS